MINLKYDPRLGSVKLQVPVIRNNSDFDKTVLDQTEEAEKGRRGGAEERGGGNKDGGGRIVGCSEVEECGGRGGGGDEGFGGRERGNRERGKGSVERKRRVGMSKGKRSGDGIIEKGGDVWGWGVEGLREVELTGFEFRGR